MIPNRTEIHPKSFLVVPNQGPKLPQCPSSPCPGAYLGNFAAPVPDESPYLWGLAGVMSSQEKCRYFMRLSLRPVLRYGMVPNFVLERVCLTNAYDMLGTKYVASISWIGSNILKITEFKHHPTLWTCWHHLAWRVLLAFFHPNVSLNL